MRSAICIGAAKGVITFGVFKAGPYGDIIALGAAVVVFVLHLCAALP